MAGGSSTLRATDAAHAVASRTVVISTRSFIAIHPKKCAAFLVPVTVRIRRTFVLPLAGRLDGQRKRGSATTADERTGRRRVQIREIPNSKPMGPAVMRKTMTDRSGNPGLYD
jgi:hypothetical protein